MTIKQKFTKCDAVLLKPAPLDCFTPSRYDAQTMLVLIHHQQMVQNPNSDVISASKTARLIHRVKEWGMKSPKSHHNVRPMHFSLSFEWCRAPTASRKWSLFIFRSPLFTVGKVSGLEFLGSEHKQSPLLLVSASGTVSHQFKYSIIAVRLQASNTPPPINQPTNGGWCTQRINVRYKGTC